jgi:hypothetical protein
VTCAFQTLVSFNQLMPQYVLWPCGLPLIERHTAFVFFVSWSFFLCFVFHSLEFSVAGWSSVNLALLFLNCENGDFSILMRDIPLTEKHGKHRSFKLMKLLFGKVCPCVSQSKQIIKTGLCMVFALPLVAWRTPLRFVTGCKNHAFWRLKHFYNPWSVSRN